jgi:hypothetical protein
MISFRRLFIVAMDELRFVIVVLCPATKSNGSIFVRVQVYARRAYKVERNLNSCISVVITVASVAAPTPRSSRSFSLLHFNCQQIISKKKKKKESTHTNEKIWNKSPRA